MPAMVLIVDPLEFHLLAPQEAAPRSTGRALRHMRWPFATGEGPACRPPPLRDPPPADALR